MSGFREHESVILTRDLPAEGLAVGARGAIVHIYRDGVAFEVEFFTPDGRTSGVVTVVAADLRPRGEQQP